MRQVYVLEGQKDFYFPHPVRVKGQIIVEVKPGGVVSPFHYEVIGAGPRATGVTVRYPDAPTEGELILTRYTAPERITVFLDELVTARALNAEFDNVYNSLEDFNTAFSTLEDLYDVDSIEANPGSIAVSDGSNMILRQPGDIDFGEFEALIGDPQDYEPLQMLDGKIVNTSAKVDRQVDSVSDLQTGSFPASLKRLWLAGYYGVGTAGGGPLYRDDADTTTADNGGTVFVDGDGTRWKRFYANEISPEMFGALGDGTDDNAALQASATAAENKTWLLTSTQYATSKEIQVPECTVKVVPEQCLIDGSAITAVDAPNNSILFFGGGGHTALPDLNAAVSASDNEITFAAAHGLSVGDIFVIYNPTDYSFSGFRANYNAGEFCRVAEIIDTTTVKPSSPLYAGYAVADVDLYLIDMAQQSFSGGNLKVFSDADRTDYFRGARFNRVANSDISRLHCNVNDSVGAIVLEQCFNISGQNVKGHQFGDTGKTLDYGITVGNSQHIYIQGNFSARRHGISHGGSAGIGCVPVRDSHFTGSVTTHGASTSVMALDWHGNCEHCSFDGIVYGGVNPGGNHIKVRGTIFDNGTGILVYSGEWLGFDFDFSGCKFVSRNNVGAPNRGAFDIGGSSTVIGINTKYGGVVNLSNTEWYVPYVEDHIVRCTNRGAAGLANPMIIDLTNMRVVESSATLDVLIYVLIVSGDNFDVLYAKNLISDKNHGSSVTGVDSVFESAKPGVETMTTDTAASYVTALVAFDRPFIGIPSVITTPNERTDGVEMFTTNVRSVTKDGFRVDLSTASGNNFANVIDVDVQWIAN